MLRHCFQTRLEGEKPQTAAAAGCRPQRGRASCTEPEESAGHSTVCKRGRSPSQAAGWWASSRPGDGKVLIKSFFLSVIYLDRNFLTFALPNASRIHIATFTDFCAELVSPIIETFPLQEAVGWGGTTCCTPSPVPHPPPQVTLILWLRNLRGENTPAFLLLHSRTAATLTSFPTPEGGFSTHGAIFQQQLGSYGSVPF